MKIALIKEIRKRSNTTSRYNPSIMKMTYQTKTAKLVPVFAARWRSICKYFIKSDNKQARRTKQKMIKKAKRKPFINTRATDPKLNSKRTKAEASTFQVT